MSRARASRRSGSIPAPKATRSSPARGRFRSNPSSRAASSPSAVILITFNQANTPMPSNHKRHHPARAGAQVAADTAAPPEPAKESTSSDQSAKPAEARPAEATSAAPTQPE